LKFSYVLRKLCTQTSVLNARNVVAHALALAPRRRN